MLEAAALEASRLRLETCRLRLKTHLRLLLESLSWKTSLLRLLELSRARRLLAWKSRWLRGESASWREALLLELLRVKPRLHGVLIPLPPLRHR